MTTAREQHHHTHTGSGPAEAEMLRHTVDAYSQRFGPRFWEMLMRKIAPLLPVQPVIVDLACGAGLLLRDLARRVPEAALHGYDMSAVMLEHARGLDWGRNPPTLRQMDLGHEQVPLADGRVDLLTMTLALHHFGNPLEMLREIRRLLQAKGVFVLCEWERLPFAEYLIQWRRQELQMGEQDWARVFEHYGMVCRFSVEDWRYLLSVAGLEVIAVADLGNGLRALIARPKDSRLAQPSRVGV